jgi:hypothetical protein
MQSRRKTFKMKKAIYTATVIKETCLSEREKDREREKWRDIMIFIFRKVN